MSNTSLSEFINACAKLMRADRPHLWETHDEAVRDINIAFAEVAGVDPDDMGEYSVHLSGFILTRDMLDDGMYEYTFTKKLVSLGIDTDAAESHVHDWTQGGNFASEVELNLPELDEDLDIQPNIINDIYYEEDDEDQDTK